MTINDLYNGAKIVNLPACGCWDMIFFNIKLWLPVWTGSKGQIGVTLFENIFWQLTICTMVQKLWIYLLWLLRYDFSKILNFEFYITLWLPVWTGSKGIKLLWSHMPSFYVKYFLTINDLYKEMKNKNFQCLSKQTLGVRVSLGQCCA